MKRYFTSDLHLGSNLINKYAHRSYKDASTALADFLVNINSEMQRHDVLIHVGDFMLSGADRHGEVEDHGLDLKLDDYLDMIEPMVVLIAGNHDDGHNSESLCKGMTVNLNQNWQNVSVGHYASDTIVKRYAKSYPSRKIQSKIGVKAYYGRHGKPGEFPHIHLCGHVHDSWLLNYDRNLNVLNINVGVDVWDYKPVEDVKLTELLDFIKNAKVKMPKDKMTKDEVKLWIAKNELEVCRARDERKAERYKRKNLTPEECQRRKEEAMRKKGLL